MPTDSIHVPPQAIEAEMAVLGSMLIEREAVEKAIELLEEGMFYKDAHRKVFAAACSLYQRGQAVDIVTVGEELRRSKVIGEIGGPTYLAELQGKVATSAHIEHYARMVREKGILRELIRASTEVVTQCYREEKDPSELLDEAQARILAVAQKQTAAGFVEAKQIAHEVIEEIEKIHQRKAETTGVPTGFKELDRKTSGLQKGDLILLAARPGQGKTSLALNIATNIVLHPKEPRAVAFYSMEMSRNSIFTRIVSAEAGVALHELRNGYFRRDRWTDVTSAAARLSEAPLFINDMPGLSVLEVRSLARRLHSDLRAKGQSLGLVIIDYLQLMRGASRRPESRQAEVAEISRGLKQLARDLEIPVIALSQLSRRVEDKGRADGKPQLSDLRESGALEQDADIVAFIYREAQYKKNDPSVSPNKAELMIAKHRNGPTGDIELFYRMELTRFENATEVQEPSGEQEAQATFS